MGYFYPEGLNNINNLIDSFKADIPVSGKKIDALGIISPHAGYVYSGKIAYEGYSSIDIKNNIIIIGPNHTGLGADYSVMNKGKYDFKDFSVPINSKLADAIIEDAGSPFIADEQAHLREHSVEVQIPLIYNLKNDFSIVPIVISFIRYNDVINGTKTGIAAVLTIW